MNKTERKLLTGRMAGPAALLALLAHGLLMPAAQAQPVCGATAPDEAIFDCTTAGQPGTGNYSLQSALDGRTTLDVVSVVGELGVGNNFHPAVNTVKVTGSGAGEFVIDVRRALFGSINFSAATGGVTVNVHGRDVDNPDGEGWSFGALSQFGSGNDTIINHQGGLLASGPAVRRSSARDAQPALLVNRVDFGDGEDLLRNEGTFVVGETRFRREVNASGSVSSSHNIHFQSMEAHLESLEYFENAGAIMLGGVVQANGRQALLDLDPDLICTQAGVGGAKVTASCLDTYGITDREAGATLAMRGTHYVGHAGSSIHLDATFGLGVAQRDCYQRAGSGQRFVLPGADCIDLSGGSTEGQTEIVVYDRVAGDLGAYNPDGIVVVDVTNGSSAAGHFSLSPLSEGYDPALNAIDKGLFIFPLVYDAAARQHKLVSVAGPRAYRMPLLVNAAQALSRSTGRQWFERRGDLRADEVGHGDDVWLRISNESASRSARQQTSAPGYSASFRNDHDIDGTIVTVGRDLRIGDAWVVGGSASYIDASVEFDVGQVSADFQGAALGLHASYRNGALFIDSQLLMSWLEMDYDDTRFEVATSQFNTLDSGVQSLDARAELGWRFEMGERSYVEPLVGLSWVRSEFDEMTLMPSDPAGRPSVTVFGGTAPGSLRANVGGRFAHDQPIGDAQLSYVLTARYWEELRGETKVRIGGAGPDTRVSDTFDSGLGELSAGVELRSADGRINALLQATGMFGDYESLGLTAGFRYQW